MTRTFQNIHVVLIVKKEELLRATHPKPVHTFLANKKVCQSHGLPWNIIEKEASRMVLKRTQSDGTHADSSVHGLSSYLAQCLNMKIEN